MIAKLRVVLYIFLFFLVGCRKDTSPNATYIGGEIVNPNENYVVLSKNEKVLDTIPLNADNFFSYQFKNSDPTGIYTFTHPPESQVFYIEKGDSLLLRLNTFEFDESLEYSGEGAKENNFLMDMFLLNEENNNLIFEYYKTTPTKFAKKIDSIKALRQQRLKDLMAKNSFSKHFVQLAKKTINYDYYDLRERYSFLINKYLQQYRSEMPKDFLAYREKVNFNDKELQSYYIYQRFLDNYLRNRSIDYCITHHANRDCYSLNNLGNLKRRIVIADSLFKLPKLRNQFLERYSRRAIIYAENEEEIDNIVQLMEKLKNQPRNIQELHDLADIQRDNVVGQNISSRKVLNTQLQKTTMGENLHKPSLIFIWSVHNASRQELEHKQVKKLRQRYPEINFIGINIDQGETELWLKTLKNFEYDPQFEFQIRERGNLKEVLYRNYTNKVLFVNKHGKIITGNLHLGDRNIEHELLSLLNR